jgi:hypothetical protein
MKPFALLLLKFVLEQPADRLNRLLLVTAVGDDFDRGIVGSSQGEDTHNGLAVDLFPVFLQEDTGGKLVRCLHEQSGGPGMDSGPVLDGYDFFYHVLVYRAL